MNAMLLACLLSAPSDGWRVGAPLSELALPTIEGDRVVALSEFRGKKLLLLEFASW